jgi:hypothetical protein
MLGLFCLSTGAWLGHALGRWCQHDLGLFSALRHLLNKDDILLGDAGFCACIRHAARTCALAGSWAKMTACKPGANP